MQLISLQSCLQVFSDVHGYKELQLKTAVFGSYYLFVLFFCSVLFFFFPEVNQECFMFEFLPFFSLKILTRVKKGA